MILHDTARRMVDRVVPFYARFLMGFAILAIGIGIIGFCMNFITLLTVKEIYFPAWGLPVMFVALVVFCVIVGWFSEYYGIQNRINTHTITRTNPVFRNIMNDMEITRRDIQEIKKLLVNKNDI
jgi:hypothetical protein